MSKLDSNYEYFTGDGEICQGDEESWSSHSMAWSITGHDRLSPLTGGVIYRRPKKFKAGDEVLVKQKDQHQWQERTFLFEAEGKYWCRSTSVNAYAWDECKPIEPELSDAEKLNKIKELVEQGEDVTNKIKDIL